MRRSICETGEASISAFKMLTKSSGAPDSGPLWWGAETGSSALCFQTLTYLDSRLNTITTITVLLYLEHEVRYHASDFLRLRLKSAA